MYLPSFMKTIFDLDTYQEIVRRLEALKPDAQRQSAPVWSVKP
jgi:hypothetical protein